MPGLEPRSGTDSRVGGRPVPWATADELAALFGQIVESTFDAVVILDDDSRFVWMNPAAARMFRIAAAGESRRSIAPFVPAATAAALYRASMQLSQGSIMHAFSDPGQTLVRADGETFEFESSMFRIDLRGRIFLCVVIRDIEERRRQREENLRLVDHSAYLQAELDAVHPFEEIVGRSDALASVLREVDLVAATDSTVLVVGESGTGKELVARALHARSRRREHPLIKLNCAALPAGTIESELFGHVRGAFTGAASSRVGRFELANRGTIFLDEIGELPLDMQAKLLRVLQERELERLGGTQTIRLDVRVIAATNRDLAAMVEAGEFRADLFFRLNVFPIRVPALRDRRPDIPLLVDFFVRRHARRMGRSIDRISDEVMRGLMDYDWPGNVRELENVVERAVILARDGILAIDDRTLAPAKSTGEPNLPTPRTTGPNAPGPSARFDDSARAHVRAVLEAAGWQIEGAAGAAQRLGLAPSTLRSRMKKLGIARDAPVSKR